MSIKKVETHFVIERVVVLRRGDAESENLFAEILSDSYVLL